MSLRIIKQGVLDVFYDEGRYGHQHLGINPGGVMDVVAMKVANALTGNHLSEAVLEIHFPGPEILFEVDTLIALSGADFSATVSGEDLPINQPIIIKKGAVLSFKKPLHGASLYLSIGGGFKLKQWLNSYSTHLLGQQSGYHGQALKTNDVIHSKLPEANYVYPVSNKPFFILPFSANVKDFYGSSTINILPGPHDELLNNQSKNQFTNSPFLITNSSNRMGYKLQAEPLQLKKQISIISTGVTRGTIQLLPSGQLIVLMADHQTTGGYPIIGFVTSADFSTLAQTNPGSKIKFQLTNPANAEAALLQQHQHLLQIQNACNLRLHEFFINNGED